MSYQAIEGVVRYDNQERISTESRWQQYLEMRSRNNNKLDQTNKSEHKEFQDETSDEAKEKDNKILFERPNEKSLEALKHKVDKGDILTPSEKVYLQQYDPQTYRKVAEREQELKEYKRLLKEAKTQEELRNAKIVHAKIAHRTGTSYAEYSASVKDEEFDYLLDEEKSTYDRVV